VEDLNPTMLAAVDAARAEVARLGRRMLADRLVVGSAGNLSTRVGDLTVITPTGVGYELIEPYDVCVLAADGTQIAGAGRPSSEYPMHRMIYDTCGAAAVVHTHSVAAVAASTVCHEIPAVHYSILRLGGPTVRVAGYRTFGSDDLAGSARIALVDRYGALLQNHGAIAYGATLAEAYLRAELIEWLADVWARARLIGEPRILDEAELAAVREEARRRAYAGAGG
jgi:L-fuculose-phosphate aldolase